MRWLFACVFLFALTGGWAQTERQHRPLYVIGNKYHNGGWHFAPGITFMAPAQAVRTETRSLAGNPEPTTLYKGQFDARGRLGFYLEVGKQYFYERPLLVHYLDFGLHFKQLRGAEQFTGEVLHEQSMLAIENNGSFSDGFIGAYLNVNHIVQLTDHSFIQLGLGVNADYRLFEQRGFEGHRIHFNHEFAEPFQGQVHARVGFGFKPEQGLLIIPSLETPILNVVPLYDGKSTLPYFNSRYRPLILSVRFLFFGQNRAADCVGSGTEKRGHELWGNDMRKAKTSKKKKRKR